VIPRLLHRVGQGALICAAIALGGAMHWVDDHGEYQNRPFGVAGAMGEPVTARTFTVTALGQRGAATLADSGRKIDTSGIWMLVRVRVTARDDPVLLGYAAVRDTRGRIYQASDRVRQPLIGRQFQPDVPAEGEIAFELPVDAAGEFTLLVDQNSFEHRMDSEVQITMPRSTAALVRMWQQASAAPATPAGPR
jgi:hypothetical protein